jgi:hypothetical protein
VRGPFCQLNTVEVRHHNIGNNNVWALRMDCFQSVRSPVFCDGVIAVAPENHRHTIGDERLIVYNQHSPRSRILHCSVVRLEGSNIAGCRPLKAAIYQDGSWHFLDHNSNNRCYEETYTFVDRRSLLSFPSLFSPGFCNGIDR